VIVSEEAGTTRDSIEAYYMHRGEQFIFVDTAGIRKRSKVDNGVEYYSVLRTQMTLDYSDCVVVVIDADRGLSLQDKKIINQVFDRKKNMILYVNKWDLTEKTDHFRKDFEKLMIRDMPQLGFFPIVFGSAKERHHIGKLLDKIPEVILSGKRRVPTSEINQFVDQILKRNPPTAKYGHHVKVSYGTQAGISPPTFIFFVNNAKLVSKEYYRFTEKRIRAYLGGFKGNSIVIRFKSKNQSLEEE
jgi:GTPase